MHALVRPIALGALVISAVVGSGFDRPAGAQDQPNMNAALNNLKSARSYLVQSTADKAGHRVAAIKLVDQAIREVHLGLIAGRK